MDGKQLLYRKIADTVEHHIKTGALKVGDKLPSLRTICNEYGVSMNTALQAYFALESKGFAASRPQSGYYVAYSHKRLPPAPATSSPLLTCGVEDIEKIISTVSANRTKSNVLLSNGTIDPELMPVAKLNKAMVHAMRQLPDGGTGYDHNGNANLKRQIAKRAIMWGGKLHEQNVVTTAGCMEALAFCMLALTMRGDTIAVESPVYFGILQLAKNLGLNVLELPTNAVTGIEIEALKKALMQGKLTACLLVSNFNNPLGSCMPDEHKREVVKLMEHYNVPLIEDDLYGDLYLSGSRPSTCKLYDESGIVLWCGSFSKTLAPGYRVGWVEAGRYKEKVARTKLYHSVSSNALAHEAISYFLENDRYDNHLRKLRQTLHSNLMQYLRCISQYFPANIKVSRPEGGYILWIELSKNADAQALYDKAIEHKISIGPGSMYTLQPQYRNCFRMCFGLKWSDKIETSLKLLGTLIKEL